MLLADGPVIHPAPFDEISFDLCSRRKDVVMMSADLSKYCQIIRVKNELPDQHLDVGMAEQNLISVAAGGRSLPVTPTTVYICVFTLRYVQG